MPIFAWVLFKDLQSLLSFFNLLFYHSVPLPLIFTKCVNRHPKLTLPLSIYGRIKGFKGWVNIWTPIWLLGGSLLHADSHQSSGMKISAIQPSPTPSWIAWGKTLTMLILKENLCGNYVQTWRTKKTLENNKKTSVASLRSGVAGMLRNQWPTSPE